MKMSIIHSGRLLASRMILAIIVLIMLISVTSRTKVFASDNPWNEGGVRQEAEISEEDQKKMNKYARKVNSVIGDILKDFYAVLQGAGAVLLVIYFLEFGISINANEPPNRYIKGIAAALLFMIAPTILAALI